MMINFKLCYQHQDWYLLRILIILEFYLEYTSFKIFFIKIPRLKNVVYPMDIQF